MLLHMKCVQFPEPRQWWRGPASRGGRQTCAPASRPSARRRLRSTVVGQGGFRAVRAAAGRSAVVPSMDVVVSNSL